MWPPPIVTRRSGLRGVMSNWRGAFATMLHDQAAVHAHIVARDRAAGGGEIVPRLGVQEFDADLLEDAHRRVVDRGDALGRQGFGRPVGIERDAPRHLGDRMRRLVALVSGAAARAA